VCLRVEERAIEQIEPRGVVERWEREVGGAHGVRHVSRKVVGHERGVGVDDERFEKRDVTRALGGDVERFPAKRATRGRWFGDA